ncbi:MAG: GntR family transcriptional regulator [Ideonella sp.]|nr:GntR family transcriptional regulator [Ideonella sp.]
MIGSASKPMPASVLGVLRQWIGEGRLPAGTRLAEIPIAEALGVSRTPVRLAFRTLAQEGLLRPTGTRGFVVREISAADVRCAVEVRGVLEGLAARLLAERGPTDEERATLERCLDEGQAVLDRGRSDGRLIEADIDRWADLNGRFHACIVGASGSPVIADAIRRNDHLPFASAGSITVRRDTLDREYRKLEMAQMHHRLVVQALLARESARVEMLMREHALIGVRYGALFGLDDEPALSLAG